MEEKTVLKNDEPMVFKPAKYLDNFMASNKLIVKDEVNFDIKELNYFNEFNKKSEKFIVKAWESFIDCKDEFLDGEKTFEEIYNESQNKIGLDNLGVLCAQQLLDKLVRLKENDLYYINFEKLKNDEEYIFLKAYMTDDSGNFSSKELLTYLRNAIAHNLYSVFIDEETKALNIKFDLSGLDKKKSKGKDIVADYQALYRYISLISENIDESIKEEIREIKFAEREEKYKEAFLKNGRKREFDKKRQLLEDQKRFEKNKTRMGVYAEVNDLLNYYIITNPKLKAKEVLEILFKEINEKYKKEVNGEIVNLPEKRTAWEFASNVDMIKDYDAVTFARFFITTKVYDECYDIQFTTPEFKKVIDEIFPNKNKFLEKKYPSGKFDADVKNPYIEMMDNIRNSLVHDRLSIGGNGKIEMFSLTELGIEEFRLRKYALKQCSRKILQENGYAATFYNKLKENNISSQNKLFLGNLTREDLLTFCDAVYDNYHYIKQSGIRKNDKPKVKSEKEIIYNREKRHRQNENRKKTKKELRRERKKIRQKERRIQKEERLRLEQQIEQIAEEEFDQENE